MMVKKWPFLVLFLHQQVLTKIGAFKAAEDASDFLYLGRNDSDPVIEYEGTNESDPTRPDFLYSPDAGPRVVEFYAPWCPHCRRYAPHYIAYARQVTQIVNASNGDVNVKFFAVSCTVHKEVCRDFRVNGYPKVKVFRAGESVPIADVYPKTPHAFELLTLLDVHNVEQMNFGDDSSSLTSKALSLVTGRKMDYHRTKRQTFNDAYLSFDFSMRNVFTTVGPLQKDSKTALKNWLELLGKTMPHVWEIQRVVNAILDDFNNATSHEDKLLEILDQFPRPASEWSRSCTKGQSGMGYTCGLWELFHIMSVRVYFSRHTTYSMLLLFIIDSLCFFCDYSYCYFETGRNARVEPRTGQ
jgi:thiol-disulfide isomerase/thioredoxin